LKTTLRIKLLYLTLFLLLLNACATTPSAKTSNRELLWPPLPLETRIQWVMELNDYQDVGIGKGFWQRVGEFVFGEEESRIRKPYGVYHDDHDRLFVVDVGASLIHVMDREKNEYYTIGDHKKNTLRTPIAVTEDEKENLYLTDAGTGVIYRYDLVKRELKQFGSFKLERPTGIAYNRVNKLLYVADTAVHQVVVFSLDGMERMRIGSRGEKPGQFNYPTDLFVNARGELLVTDALNARIQIFSSAGVLLRTVGTVGDAPGFFDKPKGVAVDSEGHIYVCESLFDTVQIFDEKGRFLLNFGTTGSEEGELRMPSGIFIDSNDYIYVADTYNKRVQVFKYLNHKSTKGIKAE